MTETALHEESSLREKEILKTREHVSLKEPLEFKEGMERIWKMRTKSLGEGMVKLMNKSLEGNYDSIFFLDKSARPAAILFSETWKNVFPNRDHPKIKFINIGREKIEEDFEGGKLASLAEKYKNAGKNILVADEYSDTGKTLYYAVGAVRKMFSKAEVRGMAIFPYVPCWSDLESASGVFEESEEDLLVKPSIFYRREAVEFREKLKEIAKVIAKNIRRD